MIDIFIYNEYMSFGNISGNVANSIFIDKNNFYQENLIFFEKFYSDNFILKKNKKMFYTGTTTAHIDYFFNKKLLNNSLFLTHKTLYNKSYIYGQVHKIATLLNLDMLLKDILVFFNFSKNKTFFFFDKGTVFGDFFFDEYIQISFFNFSNKNFNYYTIFDFKKHFIGVPSALFIKKLAMLYYYKNVKHFSLFLLDATFNVLNFKDNLNFEKFGIFFLKNQYFFELNFFKYIFIFKNFDDKNFFVNNFLLLNFSLFFIEKNYYVFFLHDYNYFEYIFLRNHIKLDIFFNKDVNNNFLSKIYKIKYNDILLIDTSISNIHFYENNSLLPVYNLYLTKTGKFINEVYVDNYKLTTNVKYNFIAKKDNYFIFLKKYFHLLIDPEYSFLYYYNFFTNILIIKYFLSFKIGKIYFKIFSICCVLIFVMIIVYFYMYMLFYFNKRLFFFKYINNLLMYILLYLNYKFKASKIIINADFIMQYKSYNNGEILNFDLLLFVYIKFILSKVGIKYKKNFDLLRSENLFFHLKNKIYSKFIFKFNYKHFFFLLLLLYYVSLVHIYIYMYTYFNIYNFIALYKFYYKKYNYIFKLKNIIKLNLDGSFKFAINGTFFFTGVCYYNFIKYGQAYYKIFNIFKLDVFIFFDGNKRKENLFKLYINLSDAGFFFIGRYATILILLLHKRDTLIKHRYFFVYQYYYDVKNLGKEMDFNYINLNFKNLLSYFETRIGLFFFNLNIFSFFDNIYIYDQSLLNLLINQQNNHISSNIYFNLEFENFILNPFSKCLKFIFLNNIFFIILFSSSFIRYLKFEIYLKYFFYYFFNFSYFLYFCLFNKDILSIFNLKYFYYILKFCIKFKYMLLFLIEYCINKIFFYFLYRFKKIKSILLCLFIFCCILNFNVGLLNILLNLFFIFENNIYLYYFFFELINYLIEFIFINGIFKIFFLHYNSFVIGHEYMDYIMNYKNFVIAWQKNLKDYYISFEFMSNRKAYGINFKLLMFNEYKDSFYAGIPNSFIHTFVRFFYVIIFNKEPDTGFYGIKYFSFFYRLGGDLLGLYVSKGNKYTIIEHIVKGFFRDSIYHKYYLGYDLNNLLYLYNFNELKNFFKSKMVLWVFYGYMSIYYIIEFFYIKFCFILSGNVNGLGTTFINKILVYFILIVKGIFGFISFIYYVGLYLYYKYMFLLFKNIYIILYTFFFINIFFNFFLFFYNFLNYYNDTLYNFLDINIDFIKQNIFNFKYRLTEDFFPLGSGPTYVYKFDQYTGIDNIFKEAYVRNLIFFEFKYLNFFKTFYSFYMNVNRITFFIYLLYLFIIFRLFQYLLIIFNKGFFFIFFNNDWLISKNPELTGEKGILFTKTKNYYFNEGFNHILGGNIIGNYYYYFNNALDVYLYNQKNKYLYLDKKEDLVLDKVINKNYNNFLFFQNQIKLIKNLRKNKFFINNFGSGNTNSLFFFKNYQFIWYQNLDYIIVKYEKMYGNYSRPGVDKHNNFIIASLGYDKYNYIFLPPSSRVTYTHLFTKKGLFYENLVKNNRFLNIKKINQFYKIKNLVKKNMLYIYLIKKYNTNEFLNLRLQYPLLIFGLKNTDLSLKKNENFKYLFPFLIAKKEVGLLYNDLFLEEKLKVQNLATVPMSAEGLTFFNKSFLLSNLSIFSKLDYNLKYNESNYKGVGNSIIDNERDLFLNYKGGEADLVKYPNFVDMHFYQGFRAIENFEFIYYNGLLEISKRYFKFLLIAGHTNAGFNVPYIYEQNLFKNLKYRAYNFDYDLEEMSELGTLSYLSESRFEDPLEPYTPEEGTDILRDYTQNAFFWGDDGSLLMLLHRNYIFNNLIGNINVISGFMFFFIPLYILILGSEVYFELGCGFVFEGGLRQPIHTGIVKAMEYYLSMSDYDMQDERCFYINIIEQEFVDILIRFYQEIFYNVTKHFNSFDYVTLIKKNNILLSDDMTIDSGYSYRIYRNAGRSFKSYAINDRSESYLEERSPRFLMRERKIFYTFSNLSNNLQKFSNFNSNNIFLLYYEFNFFKKYISEIKIYNIVIFEIFQFFENINSHINDNLSLSVYKSLYADLNLLNFVNLFLNKLTKDSYFFFNIEQNGKHFFFFFLNKQKEYFIGFDKYFVGKKNYIKFLYYYTSFLPQQILPYHMYNSYIDVLPSNIKIYKSINFDKDIIREQLNLFDNTYNFNDYTLNAIKGDVGSYARNSGNKNYIYPTRAYIYNMIDLDWCTKINFMPISSIYLKTFDGSYFFLNKYFLSNFIRTHDLLNNYSMLYIDKSKNFEENGKIGQFRILLNNYSTLTIFPFFDFCLYFILISVILLGFFIFIYLCQYEYVLFKYEARAKYYDKINGIGVYFDFKDTKK